MRILIAEDEPTTRIKLRRQLEKMGHEVIEACDGQEAWERFQAEPFPIVISDWEMPKMNGVELVQRIRATNGDGYIYVIVLTGKSETKDIVTGMEAGADDFITKPFDRDELRARLNAGQRIIELEKSLGAANQRLRHELAVARELGNAEHRKHEVALLGDSIPVRALREGVRRFAQTDEPLLLTGPIGSGQEAVARSIHRASQRADRPFIYVACAHLADQEGSVFGIQKDEDDPSRFDKMSLAEGGTLYLEGIEALSSDSQVDLCRTLQASLESLAAGDQPTPNVRVIASLSDRIGATIEDAVNPQLERVLGHSRLAVPSLAERRDDIVMLALHILNARATSMGKVLDGLTEDAEQMLLRYSWPGNFRELRSVVERAVLLSSGVKVDIPPELLREGRRVGGYTLQKQIGSGGMGEVWLAKHELLARPSAVKLIRQRALSGDAASREMFRERFQREAMATAKLRSPHTVERSEFGITDDGDFYYVMEYLKGIDLHRLTLEYGPLSPARAIYFLHQACLSLEEAHLAGLVHRDVKPANLMACELGTQYDFVKLLDFGIVRSSENADSDHEDTTGDTGMIKGTPAFLSPEAASGEQATSASDIYSLGCVAFKLLTGGDLFVAKGVMQLLMKQISAKPKPPSFYSSGIPDELDALVLSCLEKDPANRPTAKVLRERLMAIPLDEPWGNRQAKQWWAENPLPRSGASDRRAKDAETSPENTPTKILPSHPKREDLLRWMSGALGSGRAQFVEQHIESCEECAEMVGQMNPQDEFVDRIRGLMTDPEDQSGNESGK